MSQESALPKKKVYQPPTLLIYGDLTEMTKTKQMNGTPDGGNTGNSKASG